MYPHRPHRTAPLLPYCGVTFIIGEPSRFDSKELISGNGGQFFSQTLKPLSRFNVDIRDLEYSGGLIEGTKVIVLLGEKAKDHYLGHLKLSLDQCRGYCYTINEIVYIATYLPQDCKDRKQYEIEAEDSEIAGEGEIKDDEEGKEKEHSKTRRKNYKFWFIKDIEKAIKISKEGIPGSLLVSDSLRIYPTSREVIDELTTHKNDILYFDIETHPVNYYITVFSFAFGDRRIFTVPLVRFFGTPSYNKGELCSIFKSLQMAFMDNRVCIYNAGFDLFILAWKYKLCPPKLNNIIDPMIMQHRLYPEVEKSLGHAMSFRTYEPYHKNENVFLPRSKDEEDRLWLYNAKDVYGLRLVHKDIELEATRAKLSQVIHRSNRLVYPYLLMTLQGCKIDTEFRSSEIDKLERLKIQHRRIMRILVGYYIDKPATTNGPEVLGWQRIAKYLYQYKGLPKPQAKFINGKFVHRELTSDGTLYKLLIKHPELAFIKAVLSYRHLNKQAGFLKFLPWGKNRDRFTCSWNICGTDTLRLSSRKLFSTWGTNAQNIEPRLRQVIIADEDKILVQSDQAGAEALVVAYLCRPGRYREMFEAGIKSHVYVAMHLFREVWEQKLGMNLRPFLDAKMQDIKKLDRWKDLETIIKQSDSWPAPVRFYYFAKQTCHSANYDIKGPTFQLNTLRKSKGQVVLSRKQADYFLNMYHDLFPEIHQWHKYVQVKLSLDRTLNNLFGDRMIFFGEWDESLFKKAYAWVPQSTVGMLTNIAISEIQEKIDSQAIPRDYLMDLLLNGHDSIVSQCKIGFEKEVAEIQEYHLGKVLTVREDSKFMMRSESSWGPNWKLK